MGKHATVLDMARPPGRFQRQASRLLEQLATLGSEKSNAELAHDLGVSATQISRYVKHLHQVGLIQVKVERINFRGQIFSRRSIKVIK